MIRKKMSRRRSMPRPWKKGRIAPCRGDPSRRQCLSHWRVNRTLWNSRSNLRIQNIRADSEKERSAVQIPDPFTKKLIIEATLEATRAGILRGCKDLGGGGLTTGLSEIADKGGSGIEVYLEKIPIRESDMSPIETLISESQERMLLVVKRGSEEILHQIMRKYGVTYSRIGGVTSTGAIIVKRSEQMLASLPTGFLANAPIIHRDSRLPRGRKPEAEPPVPENLGKVLLNLLASPTIASKEG